MTDDEVTPRPVALPPVPVPRKRRMSRQRRRQLHVAGLLVSLSIAALGELAKTSHLTWIGVALALLTRLDTVLGKE